MKHSILYVLIILSCNVYAQRFQVSDDCHINVHDFAFNNTHRGSVISSTVKISVSNSLCSATLINRNTNNNELGFYLLTANHCINDANFNNDHFIYFNYQSPDEDELSTETSNRGMRNQQSDNSVIFDGYEYHHQTRLRLVNRFFWGDLSLLEILTPVPPHFNVSYAGWNPSRFYNGVSFGIRNPFRLPTDYVGIHHPRGDVKKISGNNQILWLENPIATGCYTITTIIDVLFGWIWGNSVSTSVICNYVDNPWMNIPFYQYGVTEGGSSGSGIFNSGNQLIGVLSSGLAGCNFPLIDNYGKLHANYSNASIKNVLNPNNNVWVDLFGMEGRKIECYDNLVLPGAPGVSGHYFPANHYQAENKIVLQSLSNITVNNNVTVHAGADYELIAAETVNIENNFQVDVNANFAIKIGDNICSNTNRSISAVEQTVINRLNEIQLPKSQIFDIDKYIK